MKTFAAAALGLIFLCHSSLALAKPATSIQKDVSFQSGDITLSGTLMLPGTEGPYPAVIFVHGSGPETRDNSRYSAAWLNAIGYAALIYDKRGAGKSGGAKKEVSYFSFQDLADDVIAAAALLSANEHIDGTRIGLHASSQGGWVAPLAAAKLKLISFVIMRSVSAVTVSDDRIYERGERLKGEGFSQTDIAESREMQLLEGRADDPEANREFERLLTANHDKKWFPRVYGKADTMEKLASYRKWYTSVASFDPIPYLEKLDIPILWLFGDASIDKLGPIEMSIANVERLKAEGKNYRIFRYGGEGHNIDETKYEKNLFAWLEEVNGYNPRVFVTHVDAAKSD